MSAESFRNRSLGWFVFYLPAIRTAQANDWYEKQRIMRALGA